MRRTLGCSCCVSSLLSLSLLCVCQKTTGQELPIVNTVETQPLKSQAKRIAQALEFLGQPLSADEQAKLNRALAETDHRDAVTSIQKLFDTRVLAAVNINPESRVKAMAGTCPKRLTEQGWSVFLI